MKYLERILIVCSLECFYLCYASVPNKSSDDYIKGRIYLIHSDKGSCTGIQVQAPSKGIYMLTAAHCKDLFINNKALAKDEAGVDYDVEIIEANRVTDLMLLSSVGLKSINVAKTSHVHQHVKTLTHGLGLPTYRTDGKLLDIQQVKVAAFSIESIEQLLFCMTTKGFSVEKDGEDSVCAFERYSRLSTALVRHGSSGGPVLDDSGNLVGIVSSTYTDSNISGFVPLEDIIEFLKAR